MTGGSLNDCKRGQRCIGVGVPLLIFSCAAPLLLPGCASWYARDTDREVGRALAAYETRVLADRESWVQRPATVPQPPITDGPDGTADHSATSPGSDPASPAVSPASAPSPHSSALAQPLDDPAARAVDLAESLRLAFHSSREWKTARESLYRSGLSYSLSRYTFGPILDSTISYLWNYNEGAPNSHTINVPLSLRQILPLGGAATATAGLSGTRTRDAGVASLDDDFIWGSDLRVNLEQPLLRGAGYEVSHEALTQAERDLIYAVREFELFRQDFSIRIAENYFQLVSQKKRLDNDEQNYKDAVYDRNRAEALRALDRNKPDDVFQARRREIETETNLVGARTDFRLRLDNFKILLGLPTDEPIRLVDMEPPFQPLRVEPQSAVEVALHNRLDLHTRRERTQDAQRAVRIARNGLLPDLNLTAAYGTAARGRVGDDATPNQRSGSVGATLGLPLDRKAERNAFRNSQISLDQARRDLDQFEDEIRRDVLNAVRELSQFEKQIVLQHDQINSERRAVAVTQLRVETGDAQQRDLADARQSLNNAQNLLINLKVQHFIATLRLTRSLGLLFIDPDGMWKS